jgi:hypothetical protein
MSEPTRYTAAGNGVVRTDPEGLLIAYGHYVELKAEVERLNEALFKHATENHRLQVQRERLTKVGDAMADYLFDAPYPCRVFYHKWKEAKEGKPVA